MEAINEHPEALLPCGKYEVLRALPGGAMLESTPTPSPVLPAPRRRALPAAA